MSYEANQFGPWVYSDAIGTTSVMILSVSCSFISKVLIMNL